MFGLGMMEILMILAIALIVVGPKKLPELAKTMGRAMGEFKRSAQGFKESIDLESNLQDNEIPETKIIDSEDLGTETKTQEPSDTSHKQDKNEDADFSSGTDEPASPTAEASADSDSQPKNS